MALAAPQGDEIGDFSPVTRRFFAMGWVIGAGEGIRTLDPLLGKQGLYRSRCTST